MLLTPPDGFRRPFSVAFAAPKESRGKVRYVQSVRRRRPTPPQRKENTIPAGADPKVRILGIDPGTRVVGWGLVDSVGTRRVLVAYGTVAPPASAPIEERLGVIANGLRDVVAEHGPTEVAIEDVFYSASARSAIRLGEGRGAAMAAVYPLPVAAYPPAEVKKAIARKGAASKDSVARMVTLLLGLDAPPEPTDASDALAIALCHANRGLRSALLSQAPSGAAKKGLGTKATRGRPRSGRVRA